MASVVLVSCTGNVSQPGGDSNSVARASGEIGRLQPIGVMNISRAVHTATSLDDGSVLVAGGCTASGCEVGSPDGATAEIFDPASLEFASTGRMKVSRDDHTATLLHDGRVLLAGGWGAKGVLATTELYNPDTMTFSSGPVMDFERAGFTATRLPDGRVLLAGGFVDNDRTLAHAEIFDPVSNTVTPAGRMTVARGGHSAALMSDGRVLIAGGLNNGRVIAAAEVFDPRSGSFTPTSVMGTPRYKTATVSLKDGSALVIGGSGDIEGTHLFDSTELFEPEEGRFTRGPRMHLARYKLTGSVVRFSTGNVLVAGGAAQAELYDESSQRFHLVSGSVDGERLFLAATKLSRQRALLIGGYDASITPTARAWVYK